MEQLNELFEIARLIAKEKTEELSDSEKRLLRNWLAENGRRREIYQKLQDGEMLTNELNELKKFDELKAYTRVEKMISAEKKQLNVFGPVPVFMKYAAAFAVLLVCSYLIVSKTDKKEITHYAQNTISPGKQQALLITANNQEIELSSSDEIQTLNSGSATIIVSGSTLTYNKKDPGITAKDVKEFNTLITRRGGGFTVFLSDSTEVILNSGSKLIYPVVFNYHSREVELEGEAFFKVSRSNKTPFVVKTNEVNITVYGTVFNVSAYASENFVQTTLVEGKVGVTSMYISSKSEIKLTPGQQLTFNKVTCNVETKEVNTEQFIAWTKGKFVFENEPVENILNVLSRWYDFNFEIKDESLKKQRFTLNLSRYVDVNKILEMISISSDIKFSIKGDSIIVNSE